MFNNNNSESLVGVYLFHNQQTGEGYVGSTNNFKRRYSEHLSDLRNGNHDNVLFQRAFNENPAFDFVTIPVADKEEALDFEQSLIDEFTNNPFLLNIAKDARYCGKGLEKSEITREKLRQAHTGKIVSQETKERQRQARLGQTMSPETKAKISEALKGTEFSKERCAKIGNAHRGRILSPERVAQMSEITRNNPKTIESLKAMHEARSIPIMVDGVQYKSINEAAKVHEIHHTTALNRLNSGNFTNWIYMEEMK